MTANIHRVENVTSAEDSGAAKELSKHSLTQVSELRDSDPKGYLNNIKLMDNSGLDPKSCPKLELLGSEEMLGKKPFLTKDHKQLAEDFGNSKEPKKFVMQDFSVKDLEIKIKIDLDSNSKKDTEAKLPNYVTPEKEV